MPVLNGDQKYTTIEQFGTGGLDTLNTPSDILDIELADVRNMIFDDGLLQPRNGSLLYYAKPTGETKSPNQILVATDSNGVDYFIAVYGVDFWLIDTINKQWIQLNQIYTPTTSGLFYGSANWNKGIAGGGDILYIGNGTDDCAKWIMTIDTITQTTSPTDTFLEVAHPTTFPQNNLFIGHPIISIASPAIITLPNTLVSGDTVVFSTTGALPAAITAGTVYYVLASGLTSTTFEISATPAGSPINTTGDTQSGIHTAVATTIPIILQNGSTSINLKYVNIIGNALELAGTSTVGTIVPNGSTVTIPLIDTPLIPHGDVIFTDGARLYSANGKFIADSVSDISGENTINASVSDSPEDFTVDMSLATSSFSETPFIGKGGILGIALFGEYIIFQKKDLLAELVISYDNNILTTNIVPLISGDGIGPASNANILNYMNTLYYPTTTQGIVSFSPDTTGSQTSSGVNILSQTIQNLVTESLDFELARVAGLGQKLYWACALPTVGINPAVNNIVLMYDLVRAAENETINSGFEIGGSAWTVYDNWNAVDIKPVNEVLYYLSANDGGVYECNVGGNYQDAILANPIPYTAYTLSKRLNLGMPANLFKPQYIYLEGYISLNTTFYVNALFNEGGSLGTQGYVISGTNTEIVNTIPYGGLARFQLGSPLLGGVDLQTLQAFQKPLFFRVYLELSQALRPHNIQIQAFSNALGSFWGITKMVLITLPENSIETSLVMGPGTVPSISVQPL